MRPWQTTRPNTWDDDDDDNSDDDDNDKKLLSNFSFGKSGQQ
jgi:hypothetical protein